MVSESFQVGRVQQDVLVTDVDDQRRDVLMSLIVAGMVTRRGPAVGHRVPVEDRRDGRPVGLPVGTVVGRMSMHLDLLLLGVWGVIRCHPSEPHNPRGMPENNTCRIRGPGCRYST
jgi:hypothetical protein